MWKWNDFSNEGRKMSLYIGSCKYPTGIKWHECKMCDRKYWCDDTTEELLTADEAKKLTQKGMTERYEYEKMLHEIMDDIRTAALQGVGYVVYGKSLIESVQVKLISLGYHIYTTDNERTNIRWK